LLIARLKDVERQERVREKQRAGEGHYRDLIGQRDGVIHGEQKEG
jgi:hypothetical protein